MIRDLIARGLRRASNQVQADVRRHQPHTTFHINTNVDPAEIADKIARTYARRPLPERNQPVVDNQHKQISGYRDLTEEEIAAINSVKEAEAAFGEVWRQITAIEGVDKRWANIARTHIEEGCSALVRSIAQPESRF